MLSALSCECANLASGAYGGDGCGITGFLRKLAAIRVNVSEMLARVDEFVEGNYFVLLRGSCADLGGSPVSVRMRS